MAARGNERVIARDGDVETSERAFSAFRGGSGDLRYAAAIAGRSRQLGNIVNIIDSGVGGRRPRGDRGNIGRFEIDFDVVGAWADCGDDFGVAIGVKTDG